MSEAELRQRNRKDLEDQLQDEDNAKIIQKVHVSTRKLKKNQISKNYFRMMMKNWM